MLGMNNRVTLGLEKVKDTSTSLPFARIGMLNLFNVNVMWHGDTSPFLKSFMYYPFDIYAFGA